MAGVDGQNVKMTLSNSQKTPATNSADNPTIRTLLERRSIRGFTDEPVDDQTIALLEQAAQHAATSRYFHEWSAIRVTDHDEALAIADMAHQRYVAEAPLLYIFLADQRRNADLVRRFADDLDPDTTLLNSGYVFLQSQNDAVLALHAMETAANALGLGGVILGSVINDTNRLIDLLKLPKLVYPVLGLAIGHPAQDPDPKPRMPRQAQIFTNTYQRADDDADMKDALADFDQTVTRYYRDIRHLDDPHRSFSAMMTDKVRNPASGHEPMLDSIRRQGFDPAC